MRISDWSSDVCSSDLGVKISTGANSFLTLQLSDASRISLPSNSSVELAKLRKTLYTGSPRTEIKLLQGKVVSRVSPLDTNQGNFEISTPYRSEERGVGKECVSKCRSGWSRYH